MSSSGELCMWSNKISWENKAKRQGLGEGNRTKEILAILQVPHEPQKVDFSF